MYHISIGCNHCQTPACMVNCPTGALFKADDGTVQCDESLCTGCMACVTACPYGAPQWADELNALIKCDSCKALRDAGRNPVCVDACLMRALDFGDVDELREKYGDDLVSEVACLPGADTTNPNLLIKAPESALNDEFVEVIL